MNFIIFGEIGAGKDTAAEIFAELFNSEIVKLGKRIRHDVDELYTILPDPPNRRKLYQDYGQGMRQIFGQDLWNIVLYHSIKEGLEQSKSFVIADGRQPNEYTFWINQGFIPVGLVADEEIRKARVKARDGFDQSHMFNHETEINARHIIKRIKDLEPTTNKAITIENNGTIDDLRKEIINKCQQFVQSSRFYV